MHVKLELPANLLTRDERRIKLWGAIHALITNALVEEEKEEAMVEEGEVSGSSNDKAAAEDEERMVQVTFLASYFDDPSGLWTEMLQREGAQSNLEYDLSTGNIVGMNAEETRAFQSTIGFSPEARGKACFNCGQIGHQAAQCPQRRSTTAGSKSSPPPRYHDPERFEKYAGRFERGKLSPALLQALGGRDPFQEIRARLGPAPTTEEEDEEDSTAGGNEVCALDAARDAWSKRVFPLCTCDGTGKDCARQAGKFVYQVQIPPRPVEEQGGYYVPTYYRPSAAARERDYERRRSPPHWRMYRNVSPSPPRYPSPPPPPLPLLTPATLSQRPRQQQQQQRRVAQYD